MDIDFIQVFRSPDYPGLPVCLSHKGTYLRVVRFTENQYASIVFTKFLNLLPDLFLKFQHDRTGGINQPDIVIFSMPEGFGRLPMSPDQYNGIMKLIKLLIIYWFQSLFPKSPNLFGIMHNLSQGMEGFFLVQVFLCCLNRLYYTGAKS